MLPLLPRLERAADRGGHVVFVDGDDHTRVSWAELHADARLMATGLQARGIGPGDHVALLGPTSRSLVTAIEAVWLAGATVVVLPLPMRASSIEEVVAQTRTRIRAADASLLLVDPQLASFLDPRPGDPPTVVLAHLAADQDALEAVPTDPGRLALLQFTSGSTSDPKGVMLPERVLTANLDAVSAAGRFDVDHDVIVSWLPLYHDMGLVGMLGVSLTNGCDLVLAGPQDFVSSPSRWMEWVARYGGTVTAGPNFSWVLATRSLLRHRNLDLSSLRVALNGAEPIDPEAVEALVAAGAGHGLRPGSVFPAYGMAEVGIGAAFPEPMSGLRTDDVDRRVLETEQYAAPLVGGGDRVRRLARLGRPVPGLELRVVDPVTGSPRRDREVGEVQLRGTSVTTGYYRNAEATAAAFDGDWLLTGDLGYQVDGELVLCGRSKDLIIVGGRNVYPEDVERAVAQVEGVRAGNVIAFGVDGRGSEALVVVAESRADDPVPVRAQVARRVRSSIGLVASDIVLVEPGSLPKTSSGKLQRSLCRNRYLEDGLVAR